MYSLTFSMASIGNPAAIFPKIGTFKIFRCSTFSVFSKLLKVEYSLPFGNFFGYKDLTLLSNLKT